MQSHLEAALLGHSSNVLTSNCDDDHDEGEDVEEFVDEEVEGDHEPRGAKQSLASSATPRTVTLQMLLSADILQPGKGVMSIEYLGQRFVGDLLADGRIRSQETDVVFASPSAWAIACKRFINPEKKSGCGWASIKYCGKKLDVYKNVWYRKKKEERKLEPGSVGLIFSSKMSSRQYQRVVVKHNTVANRTVTHDANTLIDCVPFSNIGKIQPFLVSLSTNAALVMDFHCHVTKQEVSGYLSGHWDVNSHTLQITHAFPCCNTKNDKENAQQTETEITKAMQKEHTILVGWYHSHPFSPAAPTLRDVDAQLDYQIRMKGTSDNSYTPCIGLIISPYNYENTSLESSIIAYWVIPPPESKPNEYGRPMLMSYSVVQDSLMTSQVRDELKKCVGYYKTDGTLINLNEKYISSSLYIDKLKSTITPKFPRDENETSLWRSICDILGYRHEDNDYLLSIPSVTKPQMSNMNSNLMLSADISSLLFNSGKFPTTTGLLGLPDPMAHSTLAANNMFLSSNIFKMQELLKPLSSSKLKSENHSTPLKIPTSTEIKAKSEFSADLMNSKSKLDFIAPDFNLGKPEYGGHFTIPDYGGHKNINYGDRAAKISKNDYSAVDFSMMGKSAEGASTDDTPLNLSVD